MIEHDEIFKLEKFTWTDVDFDTMGWHDVHIHGIAFNFEQDIYELYLDIDYIFAWVKPEPSDDYYTFWLAPCTWVFHNVYDLEINVDTSSGLEISEVTRELIGQPNNADFVNRDQEWKWTIDCQEGDIVLKSIGYEQYTRQMPIRSKGQWFDWSERGGISFEKILIDEKNR